MKISRRSFVKTSAIAGTSLLINHSSTKNLFGAAKVPVEPVSVSTWDNTLKSNDKTIELLLKGATSLDAIEEGIMIAENDETNTTVGYGGYPDEDGVVTLDACIMDCNGKAGSVAGVENIRHVISLARCVMQKTGHVMLVGNGAKKFALENNFKEENLLSENAKMAWEEWKKKGIKNIHRVNKYNHDTIGMLAIDKEGQLSGGVSSSGMAWKIHGRVGDSPIIGSALFVDGEVGAAAATGSGEWIMRTCGSFLIVEKMREGCSPNEACKIAVQRIAKLNKKNEDIQIGYIALRKDGVIGAYSLYPNFTYCMAANKIENKSYKSAFYLDK
ncbi:MAG: N(4)-(beta-N-acetylglucosaminyl)-L-asparaginase [Bacteroidota bacterium]